MDAAAFSSTSPIDFLWVELTNRCNLQCTHCYAESGPRAGKGTLSASQYTELMAEAFTLGCSRVQFIGGEPTLNPDLPALICAASNLGYEFIEVFTNLTRLSDELVQCLLDFGVCIATSIYGADAVHHDVVTRVRGSFEKTVKNLRRLVNAGVRVRASIIEMDVNHGQTDSTMTFLHEMGVQNVGIDRLRRFGRGAGSNAGNDMAELCGQCAKGTLCISPTGQVSPCIMSKQWAVGCISEASLSKIVNGTGLRETRRRISDAVKRRIVADCAPIPDCSPRCAPYCEPGCNPRCGPTCNPQCSPTCRPWEPWR